MRYHLSISVSADKQLQKLDKQIQKRIVEYLKTNIDGSTKPRAYGKPLRGRLKERWRYSVGDYRIICDIQDDRLVVLVIEIGHRSNVYKNH